MLGLIAIIALVALIFLAGQVPEITGGKTGPASPSASPDPLGQAIISTSTSNGVTFRSVGRWTAEGTYCAHIERQDGTVWTIGAESCAKMPPAPSPKP
jgi:hypothetical protein